MRILFFENNIVQMMPVSLQALLQPDPCICNYAWAKRRGDCCNFMADIFLQGLNRSGTTIVHLWFQISPQKKSAGVRSGDRAGQGMSPYLLITLFGKISLSFAIETLAVCGVAPSCWNSVLLLYPGNCCNCGKRNSSIIRQYTSALTISPWLKK